MYETPTQEQVDHVSSLIDNAQREVSQQQSNYQRYTSTGSASAIAVHAITLRLLLAVAHMSCCA